MSKRKDVVDALFAAPVSVGDTQQTRLQGAATGAVKAVGLSLDNLARQAREAGRLRETLTGAEQVVELDPAMIEASIMSDRLSDAGGGDAGLAALKDAIAQNGQQVPVLVRPHRDPEKAAAGIYQTACGHRRIRVAHELGIPVKAIVRALDDRALLVAQGNENAARRDLSYIERALFARAIVASGFDRQTAQAALSADKTEMSRMLQVAENVPYPVAHAIGPAPRIGRTRWLALGALLEGEAAGVKARDEMSSARFRAADSDTRFQLLLTRLRARQRGGNGGGNGGAGNARPIADGQGRRFAYLSTTSRRSRIELDSADHQAFADYLLRELPKLAEAFRASQET